jgi:hypothetical protein
LQPWLFFNKDKSNDNMATWIESCGNNCRFDISCNFSQGHGPVRISIEKGDRAYDPKHARRVKEVTVDGQVARMVLTADEEEGLIRHIASDAKGHPIVIGGELSVLESRGKVVVTLATGERDWDKGRTGEAKVAVGRAPNGDLLVQVYSIVRPGAIKQVRKEARTLRAGRAALCQEAGLLGGYAAELLCDKFGDNLDPSECARVAVEQALKMIDDEEGPVQDITEFG